jgi:hypothetical protein
MASRFFGAGSSRKDFVTDLAVREIQPNRNEKNDNDQQKHQKANEPEKKVTEYQYVQQSCERSIAVEGVGSAETNASKKTTRNN